MLADLYQAIIQTTDVMVVLTLASLSLMALDRIATMAASQPTHRFSRAMRWLFRSGFGGPALMALTGLFMLALVTVQLPIAAGMALLVGIGLTIRLWYGFGRTPAARWARMSS